MDTKPLNWNQTRRRKATLRKMSRNKIFVPIFRARLDTCTKTGKPQNPLCYDAQWIRHWR